MVAAKKCGVGAVCNVLLKRLHPSRLIQSVNPNQDSHDRLHGLLAIRKETKQIQRRQVTCVVFRHDDFPTNNTFAKSPDAKNKLGPIVVVLWGTGYAAIVTINTF